MMEFIVAPNPSVVLAYDACWADGDALLAAVPEVYLDLIPFMLARRLLEQGYNPQRLLLVRLSGADYELMRAPLGVVAAKPLLNTRKPVSHPTRGLKVVHGR